MRLFNPINLDPINLGESVLIAGAALVFIFCVNNLSFLFLATLALASAIILNIFVEVSFLDWKTFSSGLPFRLSGIALLLLAVGGLWKWREEISKRLLKKLNGIWERCRALLPEKFFGSEASKKGTPSDRADKFWEEYAYVVIRNFGIIGLATLVATVILALALNEREVLRGAYYFLLFIGGGLAAAIATWRGRQFEKQLRSTRFEKTLEMISEKDNMMRSVVGISLLCDMDLAPGSVENLQRRNLAAAGLSIENIEGLDAIHKEMDVEPDAKALEKIVNFCKKFPQGIADGFFTLLLKSSPLPAEGPPYPGRRKIFWDSEPGRVHKVFPFIPIVEVVYLCSEDYMLVNKNMRSPNVGIPFAPGRKANQSYCLHFANSIFHSIMRNVNFHHSIFLEVHFLGTDLQNSKFDEARFCNVIFGSGVLLGGASFQDARLWSCDFSGSDISGCSFYKADISGCDFSSAKGLDPEQFRGACCSGYAPKFPIAWQTKAFWQGKGWSDWSAFFADLRKNAPAPVPPTTPSLPALSPVPAGGGGSP